MKRCDGIRRLVLAACLLFVQAPGSAQPAPEPGAHDIQAAYDRGDYRFVVQALEQSMLDDSPTIHSEEQIRWLLMHVDAYRKLGMNSQATSLLFTVRRDVEEAPEQTGSHALFYGRIGEAYRLQGNNNAAYSAIEYGLQIARASDDTAAQASLQNELGILYESSGDHARSIASFRESLAFAGEAAEPSLIATASINLALAMIASGDTRDVRRILDEARLAVRDMPESAEKLAHTLALGRLYQTSQPSLGYSPELRAAAHEHLMSAMTMAESFADDRAMSWALGFLGSLYDEERSDAEAFELTRRAIYFGRRANADEILYRWEWQLARLHARAGEPDSALDAYRAAVRSVDKIRGSLATQATDTYLSQIEPLYLELADLLLRQTATIADAPKAQSNLREIRDTLESLKTAELVDYFDNDCVIHDQDRAALEQLSSTAAVIYPIVMADRLELLVSFPDSIHQVTVPVSRSDLTEQVRLFRNTIESPANGERYLEPARQLYGWLIRPIEQQLDGRDIDTLVIVPDGPLRTIPMSALQDGDRFLVEKFALATTPGLSLTSAQPIANAEPAVLANGITQAVQGFSALPSVNSELQGIGQLYPTRTNLDSQFQLTTIENSMTEGRYSIVHIATHGQFNGEHRNSFLLTYDDRMTMDQLEESLSLRRYEEEPIDLLVLSACETAAGDDRAALGMAGIAIKAGARSALASLWFVNDASTSELMQDFYRYLRSSDTSKAEALRLAQVDLLSEPTFRHPAYWAPFLLIGNWL